MPKTVFINSGMHYLKGTTKSDFRSWFNGSDVDRLPNSFQKAVSTAIETKNLLDCNKFKIVFRIGKNRRLVKATIESRHVTSWGRDYYTYYLKF